jgi:hypothetical protein
MLGFKPVASRLELTKMPRLNVIVLDQVNGDPTIYRYVLWADVPAARQTYYAAANAASVWKGATATDNTNIASGAMAEQVSELRVPSGWTIAQVEAQLQSLWQTYSTYISNYNPWIHYGSTWDGNTWTVVTGG